MNILVVLKELYYRLFRMNTPEEIVKRLQKLEKDTLYQIKPDDPEDEFRYIGGHIPILLSAPHGAVQRRPDKDNNITDKEEDEYTVALVRIIGEMTGAHVMYQRRKSEKDPNWYPNMAYKKKMHEIITQKKIKVVLDIHGARDFKPGEKDRDDFDIAVGTMNKESFRSREQYLEDFFLSQDFFKTRTDDNYVVLLNPKGFTGSGDVIRGQETITRFVKMNCKVPVAQFEISARNRVPRRRPDSSNKVKEYVGNPERIAKVVITLKSLVLELATLNFQEI